MKLGRAFAAVALLATVSVAEAQENNERRWHITGELGAQSGSTWLSSDVYDVSTGFGFFAGAGVARNVATGTLISAVARYHTAGVEVKQPDESWSAGNLNEIQLLGRATFRKWNVSSLRVGVDASAGVSLLSNQRNIMPFRDSPTAPIVELGFVASRGANAGSSAPGFSAFAAYSITLLRGESNDVSAGSASRVIAGVRLTR